MAIPSGSSTTYSTIGIREDLKDFIANISPKDTPFANRAGKGKANNTFFEWQTDTLQAVSTTAQVEGDDVASFSINQPTRLGNRCQIMWKPLAISATADAVNKAGRTSELAYHLTKQTFELKRDVEAVLTRNQASATGNSTTARTTGSLEAQIYTNVSRASNDQRAGVDENATLAQAYTGGNWVAITDGTQRSFTESLLKDVCQKVFSAGGDPDVLMVGPAQKQVVSGFTGNATRMDKSEDQKLYTAIDVYVSDFGEFKVVPNRFQRNRTAFLLQMDMWQVMYLRPIEVVDLAKTGDSMKKLITVEFGLCGKNEASSGVIRSLT